MLMRHLIVAACALAAAACVRLWPGYLPTVLWLPALLLGASAALQLHRHVGSQLLVRAIWWSNLLLGVLIAVAGSTEERRIAAGLALATGTALLALGRRGLDGATAGGAFAPIAFRTTLTAILVMAVADFQSLVLFGVVRASSWDHRVVSWLPLGSSALVLVAIVGIYRLRLWGLLLNFGVNLAIAAFCLLRLFDLPLEIRVAYVASAGLQALLTLPLFVAMARGRAAPSLSPSRAATGGYALGASAIAVMIGVALTSAFVLDR
jgi:hypothetical protein